MSANTETKIVINGEDRTRTAFKSVQSNFEALQGKVSGFVGKAGAVGAAVAGMVASLGAIEKIKGAIDILDRLDDWAEKSGIAVERLSELRFAGEAVGTPIDALASGITKLNKSIVEAAGGNKEAAATFKALGIEVKNADGSLRSNDEVLADMAERFAGYEDGAAKAALAQRVFGKSGEEMIPLLNQGRDGLAKLRTEAQQLGAIYSGELAKEAAAFNDNLTKIRLGSEAAAVALSGPLIEGLSKASAAFLEAKKNGGLFAAGLASYKEGVSQFWSWVGKETGVGKSSQAAEALANLMPGDENDAVFRKFLRTKPVVKTQAPVVPSAAGAAGAKDDPTKKLLENRLKDLQRGIDDERDLMKERDEMLDLFRGKELFSITEYYQRRQNILDEAVQNQVKAYDAQIAAVRDYLAKAGKETDRAEAEGKLADLIEKRSKVEREANYQGLKLVADRQKAEKDYGDALKDVNARIAEMRNELGDAAAIRFDLQMEPLQKLFSANGNAEALQKLDILKRFAVTQAEINKAQAGAARVQGDLQIAEERITIARERGTIGEMAALRASGEARRQALGQLREELAILEKTDPASRTKDQQQAVDRLQLQMEQLEAQIDPLAARFNTMISDAFGDALTNVFADDMKPKEAAKQFLNTISRQFGSMLMKDLATSVFGGSQGGIGGMLSKLFGGDGGMFGAKGGVALGTTSMNPLYVRMVDGLGALSGQGAAGGLGGGTASLLSGLFGAFSNSTARTVANALPGNALDNLVNLTGGWGTIPSFDVGTDYVPRDMLALVHEGERIVTADQNRRGGGGYQQTVNVNVAGNTDRKTATQIANEVRRRTLTAGRRMN